MGSRGLRLVASPHVVLRTPLLPLSTFAEWADECGAAAAGQDDAVLADAIARDTDRLRALLRQLVAMPAVRDALFVASPKLEGELGRWEESPDTARGLRVERSLVRYVARMAGRATPFGMYSAVTPGAVADATELRLAPRARYQRRTRLDNDYLFELTEVLGRHPEVRAALRYRPNSSSYLAGDRIHYAEARLRDKYRSYHLVAITPTEYIEQTLERAADGATIASLADALVADDPEIEPAEAEGFVRELIDHQLLVADLAPAVTGPEPIHGIIDTLRSVPLAQPVADRLGAVRAELEAIDAAGVGVPRARYEAVATQLRDLPAEVELSQLFQVDMIKPAEVVTVGARVLSEIANAIDVLHRVAPPARDRLESFRDAFAQRYEDREVPLTEALDEEAGIGFEVSAAPNAEAAPLLAELPFPPADDPPRVALDKRAAHLLRLVQEASRAGRREVRLSDRDVEALASDSPPRIPRAVGTIATVIAESDDALARGRFQVALANSNGPSGANLSGRFCHASEEIHAGVVEHVRAEQRLDPDAVFAEVVHLPEGRVGNIVCRPVLREYEIPFLGVSGAPLDRQLPVSDLLVSVRRGRVVLRSRRLGREVVPRLTTAHDFNLRSLGIYRFLCALQFQDGYGAAWNWGPVRDAPFLPRVAHKRAILSLARWRLSAADLAPLADATRGEKRARTATDIAALRARGFAAAQQLRARRELPRFALVADADNALPVDFDNVLSVDSFVQLVRNRPEATLTEMLPGPDQLVVRGPEGAFTHQLSVSFTHDVEPRPSHSAAPGRACERRFAPGSEWLYAKFYCGTAVADQLLAELVAPLIAGAAIDRWFFLRFADPNPHLRVRFHGDPEYLTGHLLPALHRAAAPLIERGLAWRLQLDTYEREVERYGGADGIALAEQLFHADSDAVLSIVERLEGDEGADARWRLAVRGADLLLDDLGFSLADKLGIVRDMRDSFAAEHRTGAEFGKQVGVLFRREQPSLDALLVRDAARDRESPLQPGFAALAERSRRLAPIASELRARAGRGELTASVGDLVRSFIHMHLNRLLRSAQRAQELVIYDLLRRSYESQRARSGSSR